MIIVGLVVMMIIDDNGFYGYTGLLKIEPAAAEDEDK